MIPSFFNPVTCSYTEETVISTLLLYKLIILLIMLPLHCIILDTVGPMKKKVDNQKRRTP